SPSRPAPSWLSRNDQHDSCVRNPTGAAGRRSDAGAPPAREDAQASGGPAGPGPEPEPDRPPGGADRAPHQQPPGHETRPPTRPPPATPPPLRRRAPARPPPPPGPPPPRRHQPGAGRQPPAGHAGRRVRLMLDGDGHRYREPDHDRLEDQHGGAEPPHPGRL